MFKKSGADICFDKLMTHEKRVSRAQRALLGMIKNAVGNKPGLPLNKTLTDKGKVFYQMFMDVCSNGKCAESFEALLGSLNGHSGDLNGCDIPNMLTERGQFDADSKVNEVCNRAVIALRSS